MERLPLQDRTTNLSRVIVDSPSYLDSDAIDIFVYIKSVLIWLYFFVYFVF